MCCYVYNVFSPESCVTICEYWCCADKSHVSLCVLRCSLSRILCNYSILGCDVAHVCKMGKTDDDDDAACHFREKKERIIF